MTEQGSGFKWWIMFMVSAANFFVIGMSWMSMPVLFAEMMTKQGWPIAAVLFSWGLIPLAVVFLNLPAGIMGDKFGIRWVAGFGMIAAGLTGAARGMADSVTMFQVTMFLYGASFPFAFILMPKALGMYFPLQELGKANGIAQGAYGAGAALALMLSGTVISPALGGWQNVCYLWGVVSIGLGVLWLATVKDKPAGAPAATATGPPVSLLDILGGLLKNPMILMLCVIYFLFLGGWVGGSGAYPALAMKAHGLSAQAANNVVAVALWLYVVGAFTIPVLSDRIGLRRPVYCAGLLIAGTGFYLTFMFGAPQVWIWACVWGLFAGTIPIIFVIPFEMKEVGPALGGTAMALIFVAGNLGGFLFPAITAYLAKSMDPGAAIMWIGALCGLIGYALTGILIWGVRETGHRAAAVAEPPAQVGVE